MAGPAWPSPSPEPESRDARWPLRVAGTGATQSPRARKRCARWDVTAWRSPSVACPLVWTLWMVRAWLSLLALPFPSRRAEPNAAAQPPGSGSRADAVSSEVQCVVQARMCAWTSGLPSAAVWEPHDTWPASPLMRGDDPTCCDGHASWDGLVTSQFLRTLLAQHAT